MTFPLIENVAVIGAGPAGLAALYEFLHLNKDGSSTVGSNKSADPIFNVTVFEQKAVPGGIWAQTNDVDLPIPPQNILETSEYNNPDVIQINQPIPKEVIGKTYQSPYVKKLNPERQLEWTHSGVYPDLFTNVACRFTRFSYQPIEPEYWDEKRSIYPFLTQEELKSRFQTFITKENLSDYIRYNSRVQNVIKDKGKWILTIRESNEVLNRENWYQQEFDAIVVANGHYSIPNIPVIQGLAEFNKSNPGKVIHSNAYRDSKIFQGKRVLFVGGSISTANLVQYAFPLANKVVVSRRGSHKVFPWIDEALNSDGIIGKPEIQQIDHDGSVLFIDGTIESRFDLIVFTTGYHFHYPFLNDYLEVTENSNSSRVSGLYLQTFSIKDPTLALAGAVVSGINFLTIESCVAAIAGVWSGVKQLPSKEKQEDWEVERVKLRGNNLSFHHYAYETIKEDLIDPLYSYAANERANPLMEDGNFLDEVAIAGISLKKLFYNLKEERLTVSQTKGI
ncbi:hypothetical protein CAAN1_29S00936 [[Candida] anglica]|uniref:Flavin-containing monooxygenase n=1 Tax=[Candida] anglica TaxID=148631 RepID=A0ABP0EBS5_9ASCO